MQNVILQNGQAVGFDAAVNLMDDGIREALHRSDITNHEFMDAYSEAHAEKFNELFVVN